MREAEITHSIAVNTKKVNRGRQKKTISGESALTEFYSTQYGKAYHGLAENVANLPEVQDGKLFNLIFTSPPFPLIKKKKYGNLVGVEYLDWIAEISENLVNTLTDDGSLIIEIGNVWDKGQPTMSTLPLEALMAILKRNNLFLCQQFIWNNTAKLPSPIEWVNVRRIRVKDTFTNIWWLSKTPFPKADNRNVLTEYSKSMKSLLKNKKYNAGSRPSEHNIGTESFFNDNNGAIPGSVINEPNTHNQVDYVNYCKEKGLPIHPARMPIPVVEFFVKLTTDENDIILDPFGGSNTTGFVAETLKRNWIVIEENKNYLEGSKARFNGTDS